MSQAACIDTHIHLYYSPEQSLWYSDYEIWEYGPKADVAISSKMPEPGRPSRLNYVEDVLQALDASGFDQGLVLNLFPTEILRDQAIRALPNSLSPTAREKALREIELRVHEEMQRYNLSACARLKDHPQLHPFVSVNPTAQVPVDHGAMLDELKNDHGARGIKMHHEIHQASAGDPCMDPIYQASIDLNLPIVAHGGRSRGGQQHCDPNAFVPALERHPGLRLVIAHVGGSSWRQTLRVAQAFPDTAFDICEIIEWVGAPEAPSAKQLAQLVKDIGVDRVFLGSDYPWYDIEHSLEALMGLPLLSEEEKHRIMGENARRFFDL